MNYAKCLRSVSFEHLHWLLRKLGAIHFISDIERSVEEEQTSPLIYFPLNILKSKIHIYFLFGLKIIVRYFVILKTYYNIYFF